MRKHAFAGQNTQQWANDGCKYCTNVRRLLKSITVNYYQLLQNNYYCYVQHFRLIVCYKEKEFIEAPTCFLLRQFR